MKVAWSKTVEYTPTWQGNDKLEDNAKLKVTFNLLTNAEFHLLKEELKASGFKVSDDGKVNIDAKQEKMFIDAVGKFLPAHTKLTGNDNFSVEDIVTFPEFIGLAIDLLFQLLDKSRPSEIDVKN